METSHQKNSRKSETKTKTEVSNDAAVPAQEEQPQKEKRPRFALRKSMKVKSDTFLHLVGRDLYLDTVDGSSLLQTSVDISGKVLDFSIDEEGVIRIFTSDGNALQFTLENATKEMKDPKNKKSKLPTIAHFDGSFFSASIFRHQILAIIEGEWKATLLDFTGKVIQTYEEINKRVRFCLFTSQLKAVADSSVIFVKKSGEKGWVKSKFRDFFITNLMNVNRQTEFGLTTKTTTRIFRKEFQYIFRPWAVDTVALLECPCRRHFFAHLDNNGNLRIGDNEGEYSIQENDVTGICWDMGMLWARNSEAKWSKLVLSFDDQLFDMRASMLSGLEEHDEVRGKGNVIDIIERIIERPASSMEIMKVLPPVAQRLRKSLIVDEAISSLDTYIAKTGQIEELLGKIDLILPEKIEKSE